MPTTGKKYISKAAALSRENEARMDIDTLASQHQRNLSEIDAADSRINDLLDERRKQDQQEQIRQKSIETGIDYEGMQKDQEEEEKERQASSSNPTTLQKIGGIVQTAISTLSPGLGADVQTVTDAVKDSLKKKYRNDTGHSESGDWWSYFIEQMNQFQGQAFQGMMDIGQKNKNLMDEYKRSLEIKKQIDYNNFQIQQLQGIKPGSLQDKQNIHNNQAKLLNQNVELQNEYNSYASDRKQLENQIPGLISSKISDWAGSAPNWTNDNSITGKTTQLHDEHNDYLKYLYDLNGADKTDDDKLNLLDKALAAYGEKQQDWKAGIQKNQQDIQNQWKKHKASDYFRMKDQTTDINFFDPDTYLYKLPGVFAGTASGWNKMIPSTVATIAAAVGTGGTSLAANLAGIASAGVGYAYNYSMGRDENYSEVVDAYNNKLQGNLKNIKSGNGTLYDTLIKEGRSKIKGSNKMSDDDIFNAYSTGQYTTNNADINRQAKKASVGMRQLFQDDMVATTWDSLVDLALSVVPVGTISKASMFSKDGKLASKILSNPSVKQALESKIGKTLFSDASKEAFERAVPVNFLAGLSNVGVHAVLAPAEDKLGTLGKGILGKFNVMSKMFGETEASDFAKEAARDLSKGTVKKYIKGITGKVIESNISEGIEEGKQYINSQKFQNGDYTDDEKSMFSSLVDDLYSGSKSAAVILGIPFGLVPDSDKDLLQNIKGGMLGGGGQVMVQSVISNTRPFIKEMSANQVIAKNVLAQKAARIDDIERGANYAKFVKSADGYNTLLQQVDQLKKNNDLHKEQTGEYGIDPDTIDQEKDRIQRIAALSKSKSIINAAVDNKILSDDKLIGSFQNKDKFNKFVSCIDILDRDRESAIQNRKNAVNELETLRNQLSSQEVETLKSQLNEELENDKTRNFTEMYNLGNDAKNNIDYISRVADYDALLRIRQKIQMAQSSSEKQKKSTKFLSDYIDKEIKDVEDRIEDGKVENSSELHKNLVIDEEKHQKLEQAYENMYMRNADVLAASKEYEDFIGKADTSDAVIGKDKEGKDIIDRNKVKFVDGKAASILNTYEKTKKQDDVFQKEIGDKFDNINDDAFKEAQEEKQLLYSPEVYTGMGMEIPDVSKEKSEDTEKELKRQFVESWKKTTGEEVKEGEDSVVKTALEKQLLTGVAPEKVYKTNIPEGSVHKANNPQSVVTAPSVTQTPITEQTSTIESEPSQVQTVPKSTIVTPKKDKIVDESTLSTKNNYIKPSASIKQIETTTEQQNTIDLLESKFQSDESDVQKVKYGEDYKGKYNTTSSDYFVRVHDKIVRMSRVHAIKPESWENIDQEKIDAFVKQLQDNSDNAEQLIKKIREIVKSKDVEERDNISRDVEPYIKYILDNSEDLFKSENKQEFDTTIKHIANSLTSKKFSASIIVGNIIDSVCRVFLGNPLIKQLYKEDKSSVLEQIKNVIGKDTFNNDVNLEQFLDQLSYISDYYQSLGWHIITTSFTFRSQFKGIEDNWMAGETDMLGIDKDGGVHVIDFKTSYSKLGAKDVEYENIELSKKYEDELNQLHEEDFGERRSIKLRKLLQKIRKQEKDSGLNLSMSNKYSFQDGKYVNVAVIVRGTNRFFDIYNTRQKISTYQDYKNQQTAYWMMIYKELGVSMKSVELLPFRVDYNSDTRLKIAAPIYSVQNVENGQVYRIMLPLSSDMINLLGESIENTKESPVKAEDTTSDIKSAEQQESERKSKEIKTPKPEDKRYVQFNQTFTNLLNAMQQLDKLSDDQYQNLTDVEKLNISDIKNLIDSITDLKNKNKLSDDDLSKYIGDLKKSIQDITEILRKVDVPQIMPDDTSVVTDVENIEEATNKNPTSGNYSHTDLDWEVVKNNSELSKATNEPDFLTNAIFELKTERDYVYADITYNGKTFKHIHISTTDKSGQMTIAGQKLWNKVRLLEQNKKEGQRIIASTSGLSRTNGRILVSNVAKPVLQTSLFNDADIYEMEFNSRYGRFGFINNGKLQTFTSDSDSSRASIYDYALSQSTSAANGTLMYLKPIPRKELQNDEYIPVALDRHKLDDSDVSFIISVLHNLDNLDKPAYAKINGEVVSINATYRQLINLIIPFARSMNDVKNMTTIIPSPADPNVFFVTDRTKLAQKQGDKFDLSNKEEQKRFIEFLKTLSVTERHECLLARLGTDTNQSLPFTEIRRFYNQNKDYQGFPISLCSALKFDYSDFKDHQSTSDSSKVFNGLSGIGWYVNHGIITTQYAGMHFANVEVADARYDTDQEQNPVSTIPTIEQLIKEDNDDTSSVIDLFSGLDKTWENGDQNKTLLSRSEAQDHLRKMLGDDFQVQWQQDKFAELAKCGSRILGQCSQDSIYLYNGAYQGVEYHEAFHRILELLVPDKLLDKLYSNIANRLDINLSDDNEHNNYANHRIVAEYAADEFMKFKSKETNIKFFGIEKIYNAVVDWIQVLSHINQYRLYRLFIASNNGKYANIKPNQNRIDRFNKLFKKLNYQINGKEFRSILNDPMYEDLKKTLLMSLVLGQHIDYSGSNIEYTKIDKDTVDKGIQALNKNGFDILGEHTTEPTVGQKAFKEIMDNFEYVQDDLAAAFSQISTDYIKITEQEDADNANGDSESVQNANIGEHTRSSYEFNRFDKTSSRVRFFFSTIPAMEDIYDDKQKKVVTVFQKNVLGLPQFIDVNYMFNDALNNLYDIDSLTELTERLERLAEHDPSYKIILGRIQNIVKKAYSNGKVDGDYEALLSQLMSVIRSNKHTFMLIRSNQTKDGQYTLNLQTTDTDYNARFYPMQWNQMLVGGGTNILKINKNGKVEFNPNIKNSEYIFSKILSLFTGSQTYKDYKGNTYYSVGIKELLSDQVMKSAKNVYFFSTKILDTENSTAGKHVYKTVQITNDNINDPSSASILKQKIVESLQWLGIGIDKESFDFMLNRKYGSSDIFALKQMFESNSYKDSMSTFFQFLQNVSPGGKLITDKDGKIRIGNKDVKLSESYSKIAFIKDLGNWKYQYRHAHDQLSVLATGGNKFYEMSDNNTISDIGRSINKRDDIFDLLIKDSFAYSENNETRENRLGGQYGSLIVRRIKNNNSQFVVIRNFVGFRTDKKDDMGSDYFNITNREDYVSKATILEQGGIIFPTLSDKKQCLYIDGIELPGLDYKKVYNDNGNIIGDSNLARQITLRLNVNDPSVGSQITQLDDVVDTMLRYAYSEYDSVKKADQKLDELEKNGKKSESVSNYYKKEQGAMFSSLLGIYEQNFDESGNVIGEEYVSFNRKKDANGNPVSRKENIRIAEEHFFNLNTDAQKALIGILLQKRLDKELDNAEKLGLIERFQEGVTGKEKFNDNKYLTYRNLGLNSNAINAIYTSLVNKYPKANVSQKQRLMSLAVVFYLNDISNKAIISGHEVERLFSGNASFFKWKYSDDGQLIDRTVDELKRLGGLSSTGINNNFDIQNIPEKYIKDGKFTGMYTCAEVDNQMIGSPQIDYIKDMMIDGELKTSAYNSGYQKIEKGEREKYNEKVKRAYNKYFFKHIMSLKEYEQKKAEYYKQFNDDVRKQSIELSEKIEKSSRDEIRGMISEDNIGKVEERAQKSYNSYIKDKNNEGIDVADGGAYISDTMAEMLLRMCGAYSESVRNAFEILRNEKPATILEKANAYQQVVTTVIGTQKYTAYGFRNQDGTNVYYYDKMSLAPLFECAVTGKMTDVYHKMKDQGIDMLMINSAVKLGSQGSKELNFDNYKQKESDNKPEFGENFNFDTYQQDFRFLRKQLNTDPKEKELMNMGTQMTKIVMANLFEGKQYTMQTGEKVYGYEILDGIMNTINTLSDIGLKNINRRFFKTDKDGNLLDYEGNVIDDENSDKRVLDIRKFSKEAKKSLSDRDADKNILKALDVLQKDGKDYLQLSLSAVSNASWLESTLVSQINKKTIDIETPGAPFVQRSIWQMEGSKSYETSNDNIKNDQNIDQTLNGRTINGGNRLQMINEEGSMDCVLSLDYFWNILPESPIKDKFGEAVWEDVLDKDGKVVYYKDKVTRELKPKRKIKTRKMSFEEARSWLINRNIIGPKAKSSIIGYRIPTQAESSIHALRCVDVLPVYRDTVMLPAEFTKITGSDFDIDKLFLSTINYKVFRQIGDDGKYHQIVSDDFYNEEKDKNSQDVKYYQNQLIKYYLTLLLDKSTGNILHRSIDNDTSLLLDVLNDIEKGSVKDKEEPYQFYSLSTQTTSKNNYITGKVGIGPFALNNNNHILTMMYHVTFKDINSPSNIMHALNLTDLSKHEDVNGNSIMSWLSALINAHVDIAKDPFITRLNVNPFTYNIVNLLVRTGFGKNTFYLTTQPVLKELAKVYTNAQSAYMSNPNSTIYQLQKEAIKDYISETFKNTDIGGGLDCERILRMADDVSNQSFKGDREYINDLFTRIVNNDILRQISVNNYDINSNHEFDIDGTKYSVKQIQMICFGAFIQMAPYSNALANLVKYSKIDTKKQGKSVIEQYIYEKGFDELFGINGEDNGVFEQSGLNDLLNRSYIYKKTKNTIATTKQILGSQSLECSNAFIDQMEQILQHIGRKNSKNPQLIKKISSALSAAIKSQFFDQYVKDSGYDEGNPNYMHDLVSESIEGAKFQTEVGSNQITVINKLHHDLESYAGGTFKYDTADPNGKEITVEYQILSVDGNVITTNIKFPSKVEFNGLLCGGKNTIFDRFNKLSIDIRTKEGYKDILDGSNEPYNRLLKTLVPAKTYDYSKIEDPASTEKEDTYSAARFIKLFNSVDDSSININYMIDAWDELIHDDKHPELKKFAQDLVIYSFITSADKVGFNKFFKYVPSSWRIESGYGSFVQDKLLEYNQGQLLGDLDLDDVILNNWFDNDFVRTYYLQNYKSKKPNFIPWYRNKVTNGEVEYRSSFPVMLAALKVNDENNLEPSIDPENAPMYIKIPRRKDVQSQDSQRRFTVYKLIGIASKDDYKNGVIQEGNKYPVYIKVNPKGNRLKGGFDITEYGRDDSIIKEYAPSQESIQNLYQSKLIEDSEIEVFRQTLGDQFADTIDDLNNEYFGTTYADLDNRDENEEDEENPSDILKGSKKGESEVNQEC